MTLAELEKFTADIRKAGGEDDTVIKAVTVVGNVKGVTRALVWHPIGHPVIMLAK